jgi:thiol-disulfide isomerase/thioredoxin
MAELPFPLAALVALTLGVTLASAGCGQHDMALVGDVRGKPAPDFELLDVNGARFTLSALKGKAVVVNFWATWCAPCKEETPWFVHLQQQYGPQGLQIVGVALDDAGRDAIATFANRMKVNYPVLLGTEAVGTAYGGITGLPVTFFIGRDGRIAKRIVGLASLGDIESGVRAVTQ